MTDKVRGFEYVSRLGDAPSFNLPKRMSKNAVGYDFFSPVNAVIKPGEFLKIFSGIKIYFPVDEGFFFYTRSGLGSKKGIVLRNSVAVFESDYYNNPDNEGEAIITLLNTGDQDFELKIGDRYVQGIFQKVLFADSEFDSDFERKGGLGSTGSK